MNYIINWFSAKRWRLSLSHCLEGLIIQIPIGLVFNFYIGALCTIVWYYSRKKLEVEEEHLKPGESHANAWAIGWFPWQWDEYKVLDVVFPAISSLIIAALV